MSPGSWCRAAKADQWKVRYSGLVSLSEVHGLNFLHPFDFRMVVLLNVFKVKEVYFLYLYKVHL